MKRVHEKLMAGAMISECCANFLSDIDVKPGIAQSGGALNSKGHQHIRFAKGNTDWSEANLIIKSKGSMISGSLSWDRFSKRATLDLEYKRFRFRESKNGFSMLTLWDYQLPEAVCAAVPPGQYRLLNIVDFSNLKPLFFIRANPKVHSVRNVVRIRKIEKYGIIVKRIRCKAILITMRDNWSHDNWDYWSLEGGYKSTLQNP